MDEARLGPDDFRQMSEEGNDVVLNLALNRVNARDVEGGVPAFVPDFLCGAFRDDAKLGHGVGGVRLDLEPEAVASLGVPDRCHFGSGVAGDHVRQLPRARARRRCGWPRYWRGRYLACRRP